MLKAKGVTVDILSSGSPDDFKGHTFHTSRWDYDYTGGDANRGGSTAIRAAGDGQAAAREIAGLFRTMPITTMCGIIGALAKLYGFKPLRLAAQTYTTVIRGIPDLVLMLLVYFGGQVFINQVAPMVGYDEYIDINPFVAGVSTIGFIFGALAAFVYNFAAQMMGARDSTRT